MTIVSLDVEKESQKENDKDILSILLETGWIKVISESSMKVLIYFSYQLKKGQVLVGSYSEIGEHTDMSRSSISCAFSELEALGFISHNRTMPNKMKIYDICFDIKRLNRKWMKFFKDKLFKDIAVSVLLNAEIPKNKMDKAKEIVKGDIETDMQKMFTKLMFLHSEKGSVTIKELLEEEKLTMGDDDLLGFSERELGLCDNKWDDILTNEERNNKPLMEVIEHYHLLVNIPTREDIDLIKKAYKVCYPYQIRNAITITKNHPEYGANFARFKYIYKQVISGMFQTREKNKLKNDFKGRKKPNNQTEVGFKTATHSREDMIKKIDEAASNGEEFDFNVFRQ